MLVELVAAFGGGVPFRKMARKRRHNVWHGESGERKLSLSPSEHENNWTSSETEVSGWSFFLQCTAKLWNSLPQEALMAMDQDGFQRR